jgi:hypothetical protein
MKKVCVKSVLFIILMVNALPMHGMWLTTARQSQRAATRRVVQRAWGFRPTISRESVVTGPAAGMVGQSRAYPASAARQSNQGWFSSWFGSNSVSSTGQSASTSWWSRMWHQELTPEEFVKELNECCTTKGSFPGLLIFFLDDSRLERAKKLIDDNEKIIHQSIKSNNKDFPEYTILDMVMGMVLQKEYYHSPESFLKFTELIWYLIDKGAKIIPGHNVAYKQHYDNLMYHYNRCYFNSNSSLNTEMMDNMFSLLDPILQKLIPEFTDELKRVQKTRAHMANDPEAYVEYQESKKFFIADKKKEWRKKNNKWDPDLYIEIKFNELEYREWLERNKVLYSKANRWAEESEKEARQQSARE